jgi:hypothetical protein
MYPVDLDKQVFWNYDLEDYGRQLDSKSAQMFGNKHRSGVKIIASAGGQQGLLGIASKQ